MTERIRIWLNYWLRRAFLCPLGRHDHDDFAFRLLAKSRGLVYVRRCLVCDKVKSS